MSDPIFEQNKMDLNRRRFFIATPMSGFESELAYEHFQKWLKSLLKSITDKKRNNYYYCAAINVIAKDLSKDPTNSVKSDIDEIEKSTDFIFIYPIEVTTSAIMELGYALALKKRITIIAPKNISLPFMLNYLEDIYPNVSYLNIDKIDNKSIERISNQLNQQAKNQPSNG